MKLKIGYLGPDSVTFGYMAAKKFFDSSKQVEYIAHPSHEQIALAVGRKTIDYGVLAIENVIDGVISETIHAVEDVDGQYGLSVCGEIALPVHLYFLKKDNLTDLPKKVLSHISPINQSRKFVEGLRKQGVAIEVRNSTSEAAKEASENSDIAVIAPLTARDAYGLSLAHELSIEDEKNNMTRFWIIGKTHSDRTGNDKTAFLVNLEHDQSGALWKSLHCFADEESGINLNLLLIYPNPIPGKRWEYTFLLEFKGHILDPEMDAAYQRLRSSGLILGRPRFLGSYPDAISGNPDD